MVEIVWHVPYGRSAEIAKKAKGRVSLANLPNELRHPLSNVHWMLNRTKDNPKVETPAYLKHVSQVKE